MKPIFFKSPSEFQKWLKKNQDKVQELWIGFYKKDSVKKGMTYLEALDEALCYGWIDGIRKSLDKNSYVIRFTPRKPKSIWSQINIKRAEELIEAGRMKPSGLKEFKDRDPKRSGLYSFENRPQSLEVVYEKKLKANKKAWAFFQAMPPWYQKTSAFWIMSARLEQTRLKRLDILIKDSENGRKIGPLKWSDKKKK